MKDNVEKGEGILYVVSTPIGNIKDITYRAVEILSSVDYILAEDTRTSLKLLNHYNIRKHIDSYFVGNEWKKKKKVINDLLKGKHIALISEAGTPCISDPGNLLVKECHTLNIRVVTIPGASALTAALSISGIAANISIFVGFLPKSNKKLKKLIIKLKEYEGNIILYESPYRIIKLLKIIREHFGNIKIFLFKELTKHFERVIIDNIDNVLSEFVDNRVKGEYVIIFNKEIN